MLVTHFVNFRQLNDHLFGKELFIRFAASAFHKLPSVYVFSYFPFGFDGRMWDLIVSVPDHCLSFYFLYIATKEGWTWHLFDFPQILIYDVFCRVYKRYKTHLPLKTKWLPWQRTVNFGHFGQKFDHRKFYFLCF